MLYVILFRVTSRMYVLLFILLLSSVVTFIQNFYSCILEACCVFRVYNVADILQLQYLLRVMLFHMIEMLYILLFNTVLLLLLLLLLFCCSEVTVPISQVII